MHRNKRPVAQMQRELARLRALRIQERKRRQLNAVEEDERYNVFSPSARVFIKQLGPGGLERMLTYQEVPSAHVDKNIAAHVVPSIQAQANLVVGTALPAYAKIDYIDKYFEAISDDCFYTVREKTQADHVKLMVNMVYRGNSATEDDCHRQDIISAIKMAREYLSGGDIRVIILSRPRSIERDNGKIIPVRRYRLVFDVNLRVNECAQVTHAITHAAPGAHVENVYVETLNIGLTHSSTKISSDIMVTPMYSSTSVDCLFCESGCSRCMNQQRMLLPDRYQLVRVLSVQTGEVCEEQMAELRANKATLYATTSILTPSPNTLVMSVPRTYPTYDLGEICHHYNKLYMRPSGQFPTYYKKRSTWMSKLFSRQDYSKTMRVIRPVANICRVIYALNTCYERSEMDFVRYGNYVIRIAMSGPGSNYDPVEETYSPNKRTNFWIIPEGRPTVATVRTTKHVQWGELSTRNLADGGHFALFVNTFDTTANKTEPMFSSMTRIECNRSVSYILNDHARAILA